MGIDKRSMTACFTGHREIRYQDAKLRENLESILIGLINYGYIYFGTGGARGFDSLAAETVLQLKKQFPRISLILVLPFQNQYQRESGWSEQEIKQYQDLKKRLARLYIFKKDTVAVAIIKGTDI